MAASASTSSAACEKTVTFDITAKLIKSFCGPESVDCCFKFDDGEINAHRKLLSAFSSVFATMFNSTWSSNAEPIPITDASYEHFATFLDFFYKGEVTLNVDSVMPILYLAHKYDVEEIVSSCASFAADHVCVANVIEYYGAATRFNQQHLKQRCNELISNNTEAVLKSKVVLEGGSEILKHILQLDELSCKEVMVFDLCVEWAKNKCRDKNLDETQPNNLRAQLNDFFHLIRFKEMKSDEFANYCEPMEEIFTRKELTATLFHFMQMKDCANDTRFNKWEKSTVEPEEIVFKFDFSTKISNMSTEIVFDLSRSMMLCGLTFSQPHSTIIPKYLCLDASIEVWTQRRSPLITFSTQTIDEAYSSVKLPRLLFIEKDIVTTINITLAKCPFGATLRGHSFKSVEQDSINCYSYNNKITFISALHFQHCTEEDYQQRFGKYIQFKK